VQGLFKEIPRTFNSKEGSLLSRNNYSHFGSLLFGNVAKKNCRTVSANFGEDLSYGTIYTWIQKYIPKISEYVNSLSPQLSDTWQADEVFVKMQNGVDYRKNKSISFLWNVMDRKTRFLLASKLSPLRDRAGAQAVFREARKNAHGDFPETVLTDSLNSYNGIKYAKATGWNVNHVKNVGINKPHATNNRIERMNGTLRERIKVQRGWKSFETPLVEGQRIHYNFVKPHMALEGMTPAQRAGIGQVKSWHDLLKESITRN
jgi:transposase-like protein